MDILYRSTRSESTPITASQAILRGFPEDGGLYVPTFVPALETGLADLAKMDYRGVAYEVMRLLLSDYTEEELKNCIDSAYDSKFDTDEIAPLRKSGDAWYLELFHGPTIAFKDMALSILPYLMTTAARKNGSGREIVILTATSGDTGKAALAGFAGVKGTKIMVFYPKHGVSSIQERQMVTTVGANTRVIGINGNFDDAQTSVKNLFTDKALVEEMAQNGMQFSSANSINIGRLTPQIVYYVYAYTRLLADGVIAEGDPVNFVVPTGNFGNILAAYYAKRMGLPVGKLICASNSNLERLIYHISGDDAEKCAAFMKELKETGRYSITPEMRAQLSDFVSGYADEEQTAEEIRTVYENDGYVIDPHTAVASSVYRRYRAAASDLTPAVIDSTASPFKFEGSVMAALGKDTSLPDLELADKLSEVAGVPVPKAVSDLRDAPVLHNIVCDRTQMKDEVKKFLNL